MRGRLRHQPRQETCGGTGRSLRRSREDLAVAVHRAQRDGFDAVGEITHFLYLGFRRRPAFSLRRKIAEALDFGSEGGNKFGFFQPRMQGIEPVDVVIHDFDASEDERFVGAVTLRAAIGGELKSPKPAAKTDHMGHLLIVQVEHGLFHVGLGSNKLLAHLMPVALFAVFEKALAAFCQAIPDPERARLPDQRAADILDVLRPLGDREHESVRYKRTEVQRSLKPVGVNGIARICCDDLHRHRNEVAEILQDLGDGRGSDIIHAQFIAHVIIGCLLELFLDLLLGKRRRHTAKRGENDQKVARDHSAGLFTRFP